MNKFEQWMLKRIIRQEVRQGGHPERIVKLYAMIREACEQEFYEDNIPTLNYSLCGWFEDSLRKLK
jgi:hypothetical protein